MPQIKFYSKRDRLNPSDGILDEPLLTETNDDEIVEVPKKIQNTPRKKRRDIQGLRAWAILLVIFYHFFPAYFPNGYIGVDMFFVISGYLIAMIISKFKVLNLTSLKTFYHRRIKRIFPLYYLAISLMLIAMYECLPDSFYDINIKSGQSAIFLLTNMKFDVDVEKDYEKLLANAEDLFTHTWSLCVEIQWYLIVPLLFIIQRSLGLPNMAFFIGIGSISLIFQLCANQTIAFNNVLARIWQFCVGITAFLITKSKNTQTSSDLIGVDEPDNDGLVQNDKSLLPYIAYFLIGLILYAFSWKTAENSHLRIEITFITGILIVIGEFHEIFVISNALMNLIGDISYSLYLVHWPVYVIFKFYHEDEILAFILGIIVSFTLAIVIYFAYERFYLQLSPIPIIFLIASLIFISLTLTRTEEVNDQTDYISISNVENYGIDISVNNPSKNLSHAIAINRVEGIQAVIKSITIENCTRIPFGDPKVGHPYGLCKKPGNHTGKLKFLVMGNSYANNQANIIYEGFLSLVKEFWVFAMIGCEPLIDDKHQMKECHPLINYRDVYNKIQPEVLFIVYRSFRGKEKLDTKIPIENDTIYQQHVERLEWYKKQKNLKKIYILNAMPTCPPYKCTTRMNEYMKKEKKPLSTAGDRFVIHDEENARIRLKKLATTCKKCELYDVMPMLVNKNGTITWYDDTMNLSFMDDHLHLTKFGRIKVKPLFKKMAQKFTKQFPGLI